MCSSVRIGTGGPFQNRRGKPGPSSFEVSGASRSGECWVSQEMILCSMMLLMPVISFCLGIVLYFVGKLKLAGAPKLTCNL